MSSPAIDSDNTIYFGSTDNNLYAVNPNGTKKWEFITGGSIAWSSPTIGSDGTIYIGSYDKKLYAIGNIPPFAPQNLQATSGNAQITLTWSSPASNGGSPITNYRVYWGTSSGIYPNNKTIGNVTSDIVTGLTNGVKYHFAISAINALGEGTKSNEVSVTPATKPSAPQNLQATPGFSQVTLTWTPPASNEGSQIKNYMVFWGTSSGIYPNNKTIGNVTSDLVTGLTSGVKYYFVVCAINAMGKGANSNEVNAIPLQELNVPSAPLNLKATSSVSQVTLTWTAPVSNGNSTITHYRIYRGTTIGATSFLIQVENVTTYTDKGIKNDQEYYYNITAVNAIGEGASSNEVHVIPLQGFFVPSAPLNFKATPGVSQVTLTWTAPVSNGISPITHYKIYRGTKSGATSFLTQVGNVTTYTDKSLESGQKYFYNITAVNAIGEGPSSNEVNATPLQESINTTTLTIIVLVVIVVIAIMAYLLIKKGGKKSKETKKEEEDEEKEEEKEKDTKDEKTDEEEEIDEKKDKPKSKTK